MVKDIIFVEEEDNEKTEVSVINPEEILIHPENDTDVDYPPYEQSEDYSTIIAKAHAGGHPL